jgi:hypothetical protein
VKPSQVSLVCSPPSRLFVASISAGVCLREVDDGDGDLQMAIWKVAETRMQSLRMQRSIEAAKRKVGKAGDETGESPTWNPAYWYSRDLLCH